jgi:hypothetical protein
MQQTVQCIIHPLADTSLGPPVLSLTPFDGQVTDLVAGGVTDLAHNSIANPVDDLILNLRPSFNRYGEFRLCCRQCSARWLQVRRIDSDQAIEI